MKPSLNPILEEDTLNIKMSQITSEEHSVIQSENQNQLAAHHNYPKRGLTMYDGIKTSTKSSNGSCKMTTCMPIDALKQLNCEKQIDSEKIKKEPVNESGSDTTNSLDVGDENENKTNTNYDPLESLPTAGYYTYSKPMMDPYSQNKMLLTTQASSQAKNTYMKTNTTPFKINSRPLSQNTDFPNSLSALQNRQIGI